MSADFMDVLKKGSVKIKGKRLGVNNFCVVGNTFHNLLFHLHISQPSNLVVVGMLCEY